MPSNEESVETKLQRITSKACRDSKCRFTSLFHLMNRELLWECFWQLKDSRASGIDRVTKEQYAANLEDNLDDLIGRLHRMAYIPQPVRRVYIPKAGGTKMRPLDIPVLEDKLVQAAKPCVCLWMLARCTCTVRQWIFVNRLMACLSLWKVRWRYPR